MKFEIIHRTHYTYNTPVRDSFNDVRLEPLSNATQTVESFSLRVSPTAYVSRYADFYANWVHHFEVLDEHLFLLVESQTRVRTHPLPPIPEDAEPCPIEKLDNLRGIEYCHDFSQGSRYVEIEVEPWRLAVDAIAGQTDVWQSALALMRFVHSFLKYVPQSTHVHTHMHDVIAQRRGVCQDYAHLMIGLCRSVNIPARYVSGYLASEAASATHAWVEAFVPNVGWLGLDPTHNRQVDETYVKIGIGRDYGDVPPVAGNYRGTLNRQMEVEVKITPVT